MHDMWSICYKVPCNKTKVSSSLDFFYLGTFCFSEEPFLFLPDEKCAFLLELVGGLGGQSLHGSLVETHPAPATTACAVSGSTFHTTAETALPNLKDSKPQPHITILLCKPLAFDKLVNIIFYCSSIFGGESCQFI